MACRSPSGSPSLAVQVGVPISLRVLHGDGSACVDMCVGSGQGSVWRKLSNKTRAVALVGWSRFAIYKYGP